MKNRRNIFDKLNTLLFGKDLRVTQGGPYTIVREYDFSSYYPKEKYITCQDVPKENVFDIRDYGADVNNDDNGIYINSAILDAEKTNGTVLVDGGDYASSEIRLVSNVTLFITQGSSISSLKTGIGYSTHKAIIFADNAENITITGGGTINGNGNLFGREPVSKENNTIPSKYIDVIAMRADYRSQLRFAHESKYGGIIALFNCKNISVHNIILENSAYWTFKLVGCENVDIHDFVINNNRNVANADGIDIAGTSDVKINHCFISTADDGIVIKNAIWLGNIGAMSNIDITDCKIISRTNAIKVGTETTYDISSINISNCRLFMTDLYPGSVSGISLEACDGTKLTNVNVDNITMDRCTCPIFIRLGNRNRASIVNGNSANAIEFGKKAKMQGSADKNTFDMKSEISDISISNVNATGVEIPIIIAGFKQKGRVKRVENVSLNNINLEYADIPEIIDRRLFIPEYAKEYPECWRFRNLPSYALWQRHTKNISISNFSCHHPQPTWKKDIISIDEI